MGQARTRVLIIDDEADLRDMVAFDLTHLGFEVSTAHDGEDAIRQAKDAEFDLAITDLRMPGMDGIQTIAELKKLDPNIVIILATGHATADTAATCMKAGAFGCIRKPFPMQDLVLLVEKALTSTMHKS